jgi:type IV pilus assembly protein PilF
VFSYKQILLIAASILVVSCVSTVPKKSTKVDSKKAYESNIKLGMGYLQKGDRDSALRAFSKALDLNKRSADAYQGLALVHQVNGEFVLAEKQFKKALTLKSGFSRASIELSYASFLYSQERYKEAIPLLEKAGADINYSGREKALYMLGLTLIEMGETKRAIASFEHVSNLNSRHAGSAIELAEHYLLKEDYPNAKRYLDQFSSNARQSSRSLWVGIRLERIFDNKDKVASYALALKNLHPYSKEYLEYKKTLQ